MGEHLKLVGGADVDRGYAFRPSSLEECGIKVWFRREPITRFSWRKLKMVEAFLVTEIWSDEFEDFEPGNCWVENVG